MRTLETTITQKGQVTIPSEIRARLGLKPHDRVVFELEGGMVIIRPARSKALEGFGAVPALNKPEDFRALREGFEKGVAQEADSKG